MSTRLRQSLPKSLKSLRTRSLFVLREQVPLLFVVGKTPNGFRRISNESPFVRFKTEYRRSVALDVGKIRCLYVVHEFTVLIRQWSLFRFSRVHTLTATVLQNLAGF